MKYKQTSKPLTLGRVIKEVTEQTCDFDTFILVVEWSLSLSPEFKYKEEGVDVDIKVINWLKEHKFIQLLQEEIK